MRSGPRPGVLPVALAACVLLAAASLPFPHTLAYDPWAWMVWGREVLHGSLDTSAGPSWKPLPVGLDTIFSLAGGAAPDLWMVTARAGALAALVFACRLAARFGGAAAGALAAVWLILAGGDEFGFGWPHFVAQRWSEGPLAALALAAVDSHVRGRSRAALLCVLGAALIRVEAWPFVFLYGAWLWRAEPRQRRLVTGVFIALPLSGDVRRQVREARAEAESIAGLTRAVKRRRRPGNGSAVWGRGHEPLRDSAADLAARPARAGDLALGARCDDLQRPRLARKACWSPASRRRPLGSALHLPRRGGSSSAVAERLLLGMTRLRQFALDAVVVKQYEQSAAPQAPLVRFDDLLRRRGEPESAARLALDGAHDASLYRRFTPAFKATKYQPMTLPSPS